MMRCMSIWQYPDVFIKSKHWLSVRKKKLILTDQVSFVLVCPYYLTLALLSISPNVLPPHLCSFYLFRTLRQFTDFPLSPTNPFLLGPRAVVTIAISLARPAFFRKVSRFRSNGAIAQMLTWLKFSLRRSPPLSHQVRTSTTFAIGHFTLLRKLIVHVGPFKMSALDSSTKPPVIDYFYGKVLKIYLNF